MEHILIDPGEKMVMMLRRHWIVLARDTIGTILVALVPFVAIALIRSSPATLPFTVEIPTEFVSFVRALWLLIVWIALSILWTNYYLDLWIVTDRRILSLDQVGLFNRRVTTWRMEHIQEISTLVESPLQALLNYGTLEIETAGPTDEYARIPGIPHPDRVRAVMLQQISGFRHLQESNKNQEQLLHTISHEVKGYLTKDAAALASITEGDLGAVPNDVKKIADDALSATRRGVDTVMNILDSANLKSGTMTLTKKKFDIRRAVIEIAEDIRDDAYHKGLSFDVLIQNGTYEYDGDEAKLRRMVFRNLIDNAVRYTKTGGITVSLARDDTRILFDVKDTGVGIVASDMEKLFTEGGRGSHSETVNPESTGYGLFVAKQVVEAHGGHIGAESDGAHKGSRFFVQLPSS